MPTKHRSKCDQHHIRRCINQLDNFWSALLNYDSFNVQALMERIASSSLCSTTGAQILLEGTRTYLTILMGLNLYAHSVSQSQTTDLRSLLLFSPLQLLALGRHSSPVQPAQLVVTV